MKVKVFFVIGTKLSFAICLLLLLLIAGVVNAQLGIYIAVAKPVLQSISPNQFTFYGHESQMMSLLNLQ